MNEEKINKVYDDFEYIIANNFYKYAFTFLGAGIIALWIKWGNINFSTFLPMIAAVPAAMALCASDINRNVRKFKNEHRNFKFSTNAFKLDNNRKKSLSLAQKQYKNDYVEKCEITKKEVVSPVHANFYTNHVELEKVKVKRK